MSIWRSSASHAKNSSCSVAVSPRERLAVHSAAASIVLLAFYGYAAGLAPSVLRANITSVPLLKPIGWIDASTRSTRAVTNRRSPRVSGLPGKK